MNKILIANRGEIAVRLMRACRELGIGSVAVYSEADQRARHVRLADEALCIGPAAPQASYLNVERLLAAARQSGAQAVHPGYGFLSENAGFAQAVVDAGLIFIGPPPAAIRAMGSKAEARQRMIAAGVPVVPGYQGADDDASLERAAAEIGFPVLVKAAAGGGGKGMRVVIEAAALPEALAAARREATSAFGEGRLILERYIPQARHIEFQVLGDEHGNVMHLFERECSVQRRHQKIIEETPAMHLPAEMRRSMGAAAVAAARSIGYTNTGTVEFIVTPDASAFYFLEMNTRLQVEHPITEAITGLDLAQWQIRIARGEALPPELASIQPRGHAIECRLYAEDPAGGFLPTGGRLYRFVEPRGPGIRVDAGFASGDEISLHYDPLIAKLIVHAEDRPAALRRMAAALGETVVLGLPTNWLFLRDVLAHPDFQAGRVHTTWVEQTFGGWRPPECGLPPEVLIAAALTEFSTASPQAAGASPESDPFSPWRASSGFRLGE